MDEVAMRGVNLHGVEPGIEGADRGLSKRRHHVVDLGGGQRTRHRE